MWTQKPDEDFWESPPYFLETASLSVLGWQPLSPSYLVSVPYNTGATGVGSYNWLFQWELKI